MPIEIIQGLAIPFIGTTLGAACVYLLRGELDHRVQKLLPALPRASWSRRPSGVS